MEDADFHRCLKSRCLSNVESSLSQTVSYTNFGREHQVYMHMSLNSRAHVSRVYTERCVIHVTAMRELSFRAGLQARKKGGESQ